ncbi:NAD(P)-binding protein, partial [Kitasatospora sp. NPDC059817]|uniref:NAD(P)-binding protein n=1 Tax=Kitasatospora sp. NPDC059817 TaxID=3346961 RepID=UPI00364BF929
MVGAGFAGTLVAHRLGAQGRRVLVLEAGRAAPTGTVNPPPGRAGGGRPPTTPSPTPPRRPAPPGSAPHRVTRR